MNQEETVKFIYDKSTQRPKRLENNFFILYSPERIQLQPGEIKYPNMKLKIKFSKNIIGTCMLLQTFSDYGLKLLNSNMIAQEENNAIIQNHLNVNENNLPSWILMFELFNKSMNNIF